MDEEERLRELLSYSVLDTPPEPHFDRITAIAASVFDKPICTMAFADSERHFFKSRYGVDATEMPRRLSFCDHTIAGDEVFVVGDALADPRFAEAPVVAGLPHVRFYAGAPLITPSGARIGSLCVLDTRPGTFTDRQKQVLLDLAHTSIELLEARSRQIRLAEHSVEIAHLARHDPLTGLANRRLLSDHMDAAMAQVHEDVQVAVLYIDLDRFKPINDQFGHHAGDELLRQVAVRLRANLRASDTVARLGGDEFAVVQITPRLGQHAGDLAGRLIEALSRPYVVEGHTVSIGVSIGIAYGHDKGQRTEHLFRAADRALYRAKSQGGNTFCFAEAVEAVPG